MFGRIHYTHAHPPLEPHSHHNAYEIFVLEQGTQTYFVNETRYDLTGGDVFFTRPDEIHSTGSEPEKRSTLYWFRFRVDPAIKSLLGLTPEESQILRKRLDQLPFRQIRHAEILLPTIKRIFQTYSHDQNPMRIADIRNLLLRFMLDFVALSEKTSAPPVDIRIRRSLDYITKNLTSKITLKQLAKSARLSESFFMKKFTQQMGIPPLQYILVQKIEKGKELLTDPKLTITEIAIRIGFSTSQHFATVFKKITGSTPRDFRGNA